ncbi:MAG: hypothetical protein GXP29_09100 [Planctomycetes bacterium]|nr:hypothetical protein [Planctomycetota bacterium]
MIRRPTSQDQASLKSVLLGRAALGNARTTAMQTLLIVAWYWTVFPATSGLVQWQPGTDWFGGWPVDHPTRFVFLVVFAFFRQGTVATIHLTQLLVGGVLSWLVFQVGTRRFKPTLGAFIQSWWRTCLWGFVALPIGSLVLADVLQDYAREVASGIARNYYAETIQNLFWLACVIIAPTWIFLAESKRPTGLRLSRWKPICPDCGYAIRGLRSSRCPECGSVFPTKRTSFRRWAFRRLAWERLPRGLFSSVYLSLACIVFRPRHAARSVAIPDRWSRCRNWAILHLFFAVTIAVLLGNGQAYIQHFVMWLGPQTPGPPTIFRMGSPPPVDRLLVWAGQSFAAWSVFLLMIVAIACTISMCVPGRHRAAKLGGVKWSLYLTALFPYTLLCWYGFHFVFRSRAPVSFPGFPFTDWYQSFPLWLVVGPFGVWWAIGMAANQFDRDRGCASILAHGLAFFGSWLLIRDFLFAPGALDALL